MAETTERREESTRQRWQPVEIRERGVLAEVLRAGMKTEAGGDADSLKNAGTAT